VAHNRTQTLTTVEWAVRAVEMERRCRTEEEIEAALDGRSAYRFLTVGQLIDPTWFSDTTKLCDPSITDWYEAALRGPEHFEVCFRAWDTGLWDGERCRREFRKKGIDVPRDVTEKGVRATFSSAKFVLRGTIDLDLYDRATAEQILTQTKRFIDSAIEQLTTEGHFGPRTVYHINPTTLGLADG